jgi:hypothetical protein
MSLSGLGGVSRLCGARSRDVAVAARPDEISDWFPAMWSAVGKAAIRLTMINGRCALNSSHSLWRGEWVKSAPSRNLKSHLGSTVFRRRQRIPRGRLAEPSQRHSGLRQQGAAEVQSRSSMGHTNVSLAKPLIDRRQEDGARAGDRTLHTVGSINCFSSQVFAFADPR